jgi:hypothetical protein
MRSIFFILLLSSFLWSGIGNVAALQGSVSMIRDIQRLKVKSGMELEVEDKVITKEKSRLQAILNDNTIVTIGPNSIFVFDAYKFDGTNDSQVEMHIEHGFFRSITGQIGKLAPNRFNIKTASTTIGIRGTDFSANVSDKKEIITCHKGSISVTVEKKIYIVDEGEQLILVKKSAKKSNSDDELPSSFSVQILDAMSALNQTESNILNDEGVSSSENSLNSLDRLGSDILSEITQQDSIPLENPTVEFPNR